MQCYCLSQWIAGISVIIRNAHFLVSNYSTTYFNVNQKKLIALDLKFLLLRRKKLLWAAAEWLSGFLIKEQTKSQNDDMIKLHVAPTNDYDSLIASEELECNFHVINANYLNLCIIDVATHYPRKTNYQQSLAIKSACSAQIYQTYVCVKHRISFKIFFPSAYIKELVLQIFFLQLLCMAKYLIWSKKNA